jgi:murein tripeptide amidase MpaA
MYRTVAQLDSLTAQLAAGFPQLCARVRLPEASVEGRDVYALRMRAGGGADRRGVLLVGGTHSRELMNPDALVELAVDLVVSYLNGQDIAYGGRTWPARDIKVILESLDLWLLPCSNPDGRHHVMTVDDLWRKNRRDNPQTACDGVDLNRNVGILWGVTEGQTSCSPCSDVYAGPSAFSEPEPRNVKHLLDTNRIDCFADVHSYSELVLYPWGHAPTQTADPAQRFTGLPNGTCTPIGQAGYKEYMTPRDLLRFQTVAQRIVDAIAAVRGRAYTPQPGIGLYPTTGTHGDYAYSRHIADPASRKTYGLTIETGPWVGDVRESFHPADPTPIKEDTKSGLLALVQQCICAIELIGSQQLQRETEVDALRRVRDELLGTTEAGREWITLFERVQIPLTPVVLGDQRLAREAAALLESAGRLVEDDQAVLAEEDVERGLALIRDLSERAEAGDVRADLEAVRAELERARGVASGELLQTLMRRGPGGQG